MNEPRWKTWADDVNRKELAASELRNSEPRWEGPEGSEGAEATIDRLGRMKIRLKGGDSARSITQETALSLAQFIVNWYAPKPISIL